MIALMLDPLGILLPESVLQSDFFAILATFVAINTVMYAALAIAKTLPRVYLGDLLPGQRRRFETRSIYPETPPDAIPKERHGEAFVQP
ncbi:hypothetical protein [Cryobacterium gelidum]|uniref:hypothetical protein n=1 Tax=Cryobacterium gelidum TaxID=1259164 RepID=UPI001F547C06|nr:hypothetical protein [Cryobacterium gelidum]